MKNLDMNSFEKKTKAIEDQGEKQRKTTKEHEKQLVEISVLDKKMILMMGKMVIIIFCLFIVYDFYSKKKYLMNLEFIRYFFLL